MNFANLFHQYMDLVGVAEASVSLAKNMRTIAEPDEVISIVDCGCLPGFYVANELDILPDFLTVKREYSISQWYESFPHFVADVVNEIKRFVTPPTVLDELSGSVEDKTIFLIDDAVATGLTFQIAKGYLLEKGAKQVITGLLTSVRGRGCEAFVEQGRYSSPWSKHSDEYKTYQGMMSELLS